MNASQKKIIQLEFTIHALEELVKTKTNEISSELEIHKRLKNDIKQILDASSDATLVIDKDYNIVYTSKSFNLLHGHPEDIVGQKCYDVVPEKEYFTKDCSLKRILKGGKKFSIEKELKALDGTTKLYNVDVIPYNDSHGDFFGIIKNYRDITEGRKAEGKLAKKILEHERLSEKYRILFETSADAIMLFNDKGFFDCNKATLELFGFSARKEFMKIHPGDISVPKQPDGQDSFTASNKHIENAFRKGTDFFEWVHKRQDGTLFPAEVLLSRMEYQGNIVVQATVRNITERKQAEAKLAELSEEYRVLFESSADAIMLHAQEKLIDCNRASLELFGFSSKEELAKMSPGSLSPAKQPDGRDSLKTSIENMEKACREGTNFFEWFFLRQDSTMFPAEVLLSRVEYQGNIMLQATIRDISERKDSQKIAEENAQQQGRIEMANNMLHDIGNAMTGINSYIIKPQMEKAWQEVQSLCQLRDLFTGSEDEFIKVLGKEKQHALNDFMNALISSLEGRHAKHLEFSEKISVAVGHVCSVLDLQRHYLRGKTSLLAIKINLATIISDTLVMLSGSLQKRNIKVSLDVGDKNVNISGDQTRLIRVFLNIIKNTCEAFDEMKSIKDGRKLEITMNVHDDKKEIQITFLDNGIGFTVKTGKKLFERGFTSKSSGSGIGLHECRSVIESHDGTITMKSDGVNKGALTIITFPTLK